MASEIEFPYSKLRDTIGAYSVGSIITFVLSGWTLHQALAYFNNYPNDSWRIKAVVGVLAFLNTLHVIFTSHNLYHWTVIKFGHLEEFNIVPFSYGANFGVLGLTTAIVQIWYASRIYVLSGRKKIFPIIVTFLAIFQLGWSFGAMIRNGFILKKQSEFHTFSYGAYSWLLSAGLADFIIVVSMIFYLTKTRQGFNGTTAIISRIIRLTLETNLLTSILAILDLILFLSIQSGWNVAINISLTPLYINSLLTLLLARERFKESLQGRYTGSGSGGGRSGGKAMELESKRMTAASSRPNPHGVAITTFTQSCVEGEERIVCTDISLSPGGMGGMDSMGRGRHDLDEEKLYELSLRHPSQ
ncbi:hypothetical protein BT69DRAFT_676708 [Atractiella rhizophila]|nr:hypothetical protein BT69DRAFT_702566 [Atractiella rhizophila]KAH8917320.1 hypothetical protein BT69DRAFT_676708 [Atractiella rhizophila]